MKCPHGLEIEEDESKFTEPGTYCKSCVGEALINGSLGIDIGYFREHASGQRKNKEKAERRKLRGKK